jgi:hypothetical protein
MAGRHRRADDEEQDTESSRADCEFIEATSYVRALAAISKDSIATAATIRAEVIAFQGKWKASNPGGPLPQSFHHKKLGSVRGQYRVSQIYVCRANYRVVILFVHTGRNAYVVDVFKKTRQENRQEVKTALARAAKCWEELPAKVKRRED